MLIFIDTSSLVKRYVEEHGSPSVDSFFSDGNEIGISAVTPLEMRSALNRKLRENTISADTYERALGYFNSDTGSFAIVPFSHVVVEKAAGLIDAHGSRTLDAIQIGSALVLNPDKIVTSDREMLDILKSLVAEKVGFI
jgi:uncharacterized protein